jgi:hypothetical protein
MFCCASADYAFAEYGKVRTPAPSAQKIVRKPGTGFAEKFTS